MVVSHDRSFLDNVVTSLLVFGDHGHITESVGGYQAARALIGKTKKTEAPQSASEAKLDYAQAKKDKAARQKLERELNRLPDELKAGSATR